MNTLETHLDYFFWPPTGGVKRDVKTRDMLGGFATSIYEAARAIDKALNAADSENMGNLVFMLGGGMAGTPEADDFRSIVEYGYNNVPHNEYRAALALILLGHMPADVAKALRWEVELIQDDEWSPEKEERAMEAADHARESAMYQAMEQKD